MHLQKFIIPVFCLFILCLFSIGSTADDSGATVAGKALRLKEIKFPDNFDFVYDVEEFAVVSKRTSIVVIDARDTDMNHHLYLGKLKRNGKLEITDFSSVQLGSPSASSLVWLEGSNIAPSVAQGVVFFGFESEEQDHLFVYAFAFDADGKIIAQPQALLEVGLPAGSDELYVYSVEAGAGDHSIGVVISYEAYNSTTKTTTMHARFIETDASGAPVSDIRVVPFDSSPYIGCTFQRPYWNGSMWYVPARLTIKIDGEYYLSGHILMADSVFLAGPNPGATPEFHKYYDGGTETIPYAFFLQENDDSSAPATADMKMLQHLYSITPENKPKLDKSNHQYFVRQMTNECSLKKKKKVVRLQPMEGVFKRVGNMKIYNYYEYTSDFIPAGDGRHMAAWVAHLTRRGEGSAPAASWLEEGMIRLIAVDDTSGTLDIIKEYKFKGEEYPRGYPSLHYRDGRYWMTIQSRDPNASKTHFYVATVKQ